VPLSVFGDVREQDSEWNRNPFAPDFSYTSHIPYVEVSDALLRRLELHTQSPQQLFPGKATRLLLLLKFVHLLLGQLITFGVRDQAIDASCDVQDMKTHRRHFPAPAPQLFRCEPFGPPLDVKARVLK
jgi:hypothetical protein